MKIFKSLGLLLCVAGALSPGGLLAQHPTAAAKAKPFVANRPPMERAFGPRGPMGRWWDNPEIAQKIGLTEDQKKKMNDIFQQHRLKLIDLDASLKKEEFSMEPLLQADQPDEGKILAQIDRVAQARAELEKANARMLLGLRRTLTPEQWKKLQEEHHREGERFPHFGGHGGPGGPEGRPPMGGGPGPRGMEE